MRTAPLKRRLLSVLIHLALRRAEDLGFYSASLGPLPHARGFPPTGKHHAMSWSPN